MVANSVFERLLSRICGNLYVAFEDVLLEMDATALGQVLERWSVCILGGAVWSCPGRISKERSDTW